MHAGKLRVHTVHEGGAIDARGNQSACGISRISREFRNWANAARKCREPYPKRSCRGSI
jgi:hypothetical protein